MHFDFSPADESFRDDVRQFIADNWTHTRAGRVSQTEQDWAAQRNYEKKLAAKGWLTMAWPEKYGGLGASHIQQLIFREDSAYAGAPGAGGQGISMVGPCLMVHGTDEQKRRFLPGIASADVVWSQGFSEPGAGSALASLQTRAGRDGDDYVINGQKIWTSDAHNSDWIHLLTRTDPDAPKHRGISYFLVDMKTPGIETRPLIDQTGDHYLNETFFTDVRVPADQMLGEVNRGWYVAATLLDFERSGVNYPATARRTVEQLTHWATNERRNGMRVIDHPGVRNKLAELHIECEISRLIAYRVVWMQSQNLIPNYEASMSKLFGTELSQRVYNAAMNIIGLPAQLLSQSVARSGVADVDSADEARAPLRGKIGNMYMATVPYTIFAGTSEIQRNIMATRGLGLPRQ